MNHLSWHQKSPVLAPAVPFLCVDEVSNIRFDQFEAKLTQLPRDLKLSCSELEYAAKSQAILYFGLLSFFLANVYKVDDFLVISPEGQTLVDSSKLWSLLHHHVDNHVLKPWKGNVLGPTKRSMPLSRALAGAIAVFADFIIPHVKQMEGRGTLDPWASGLYTVYLSIDILLDSLYHLLCQSGMLTPQNLQRRSFFVSNTAGLARGLLKIGRCPSLIRRLHLTSAQAYQLLSLPVNNNEFAHHSCSLQDCSAFNIDQKLYETKHSGDCDGLSCHLVRVDCHELMRIIDNASIPLVSSSIDSKSNISLQIVPAMDTGSLPYTAISHVWAGGLGNFVENALPECQLRHIHIDVDNFADISPRDPNHTFTFFDIQATQLYNALFRSSKRVYWLDTLCVPVRSAHHRKRAIDSMAHVYAGASNVLVLDPELSKVTRTGLTMTQLDLVVACSPWMARSWTLQEGALAIEIRLKFKDTVFRLPASTGFPILSRSLIQKSWHNDVDSKAAARPSHPFISRTYHDLLAFSFRNFPIPDMSVCSKRWAASRRRSPRTSHARFIAAWNDLNGRSTTQPEDLAAILATLINLSAGEVLNLPKDQRMKALLKTQTNLPAGILFASPALDSFDWAPDFPNCGYSKLELEEGSRDGSMVVTDLGLEIKECHHTVLVGQSHIPASGRFILKDFYTDFHALIIFDSAAPDQPKPPPLSQKLFLFSSHQHNFPGYAKGLCFLIRGDTKAGIFVIPFKSFQYKKDFLDKRTRQPFKRFSGETYITHHPFRAADISANYPLIVGISEASLALITFDPTC